MDCTKCGEKITDPQLYIELEIKGWRHGVSGFRSGSVKLHLNCYVSTWSVT